MLGRLKTFLRIVYTTKNWLNVFLIKFGFKKNCVVLFRNGHRLEINEKEWSKFLNYMSFFRVFPKARVSDDSVRIKYNGKDLVFYFGKWGPNIISEVFGAESYKKMLVNFSVKNRDVIDIGASIGDSAIFFGLLGARKVYGFEPFPPFYDLAVKNIKVNNMENICRITKSAIGAENGNILIDSSYNKMLGVYTEKFETGEEIPIFTLEEVVKNYGIKNGVLKLDCEGYEYDIILSTDNEILRHFDRIIMEYHYGFKKLKTKLEKAGFRVKYTRPIKQALKREKSKYGDVSVGNLTAERI